MQHSDVQRGIEPVYHCGHWGARGWCSPGLTQGTRWPPSAKALRGAPPARSRGRVLNCDQRLLCKVSVGCISGLQWTTSEGHRHRHQYIFRLQSDVKGTTMMSQLDGDSRTLDSSIVASALSGTHLLHFNAILFAHCVIALAEQLALLQQKTCDPHFESPPRRP
jgi:hypothetical protein